MATITQGILGGFSGKAGTVIGFIRGGVAFIRGLAQSYTDAKTPAQLEQRSKFSLVVPFLKCFVALIRLGYKNSVVGAGSAFGEAMQYNLKNGIKGLYPLLEIDYTKILLGKGNLPGLLNPVVTSLLAGKVTVAWDDNTWDGDAKATDKVIIAVYNPILKKAVSFAAGVARNIGTTEITVPDLFSGAECQVFAGFTNAEETVNSNIENSGAVVVA